MLSKQLEHAKTVCGTAIKRAEKVFNQALEGASNGSRSGLFWILISAALATLLIFGLAVAFAIAGKEPGQFGDFIGGTLNPILTFLTFVGLLITIVLQQSELKDTRIELSRSADALQAQVDSISLQNFESTFFQLLALYNSIVADMATHELGKSYRARGCFRVFTDRLRQAYDRNGTPNEVDRIRSAYQDFWKDNQQDLGHYYRCIYNIVRFINEIHTEKKALNITRYIRIFRSQLSDYEITMLFYNGLSMPGEKSKIFIERYAMLNNVSRELLLDPSHRDHDKLYLKGAFRLEKGSSSSSSSSTSGAKTKSLDGKRGGRKIR